MKQLDTLKLIQMDNLKVEVYGKDKFGWNGIIAKGRCGLIKDI